MGVGRNMKVESRITLEHFMSAGGLIVSVLALIVSIWSANKTASITEEEFNKRLFSDLRPWVSVKPVITALTFSSGSANSLKLVFELQNHGKAPALKVEIIDGIRSSSSFPSYDNPIDKCESKHDETFSLGADNVVLLPDEKIEVAGFGSISYPASGKTIYLVGCVDYQTNIDKLHHQTGFSYEISPKGYIKYDFSGDVGAQDLEISANRFSGNAKAD